MDDWMPMVAPRSPGSSCSMLKADQIGLDMFMNTVRPTYASEAMESAEPTSLRKLAMACRSVCGANERMMTNGTANMRSVQTARILPRRCTTRGENNDAQG